MRRFILLTVTLFSLLSCEEDIKFSSPSVQGLKNDVFWRATNSKVSILSDGTFLLEAYTATETLTLQTTSTIEQSYILGTTVNNTAVFVRNESGKVIRYITGNEIGNGQITIVEYDEINKTISGNFKCNVKNIDVDASSESNVNFQQGVFYKVPISVSIP